MTCEQFENIVDDLAREEALDTATIEAALTHAEICSSCDARMEEAESLSTGIRLLSERHAFEQASPEIEKTLLAKFGQQFGKEPWGQQLRQEVGRDQTRKGRELWAGLYNRPLPGLWIASLASIAAAAILFVSLTVQRDVSQPGGSTPPSVVAAADNGNETYVDAGSEGTAVDSFVPLSATFDSSSLDDDAVVRVVLSDSALESFGLPAGEAERGQVVADLAVASDGMPQAIRVVGW